jgi:acyl-CoA synthetase (AMP-forming)/AMP-acid ligase II
MSGFNLADLLEVAADKAPHRLAVVAGEERRTYTQLDERANRLGHHLQGLGVRPGDHVAVVSWNRIEWVEALFGCWKIRALPVNVNHRYVAHEVHHVLADSDAVAVVCESEFAPMVDGLRASLPRLGAVLELGDAYESALAVARPDRDFAERSSDDTTILYTGGTTGEPKGVVWRHEDLLFAALGGGNGGSGPPIATPTDLPIEPDAPRWPMLVTSPLMHGNGQWNTVQAILAGAVAIVWTGHRFDPAAVAALAEAEGVLSLVLIGDGMGRPFADHLEAHAGQHDLSSLLAIVSGGAAMSARTKARLVAALPHVVVVDGFGASESGTNGTLIGSGDEIGRPRFAVGPDIAVLSPDLRPLPVGEVGLLGRRGHVPLGYHGDPEKTAATFPTDADGVRWAIPGDHAVLEADGTVTMLGRGSRCINTGGEKVFPEEVEDAIKTHPAVLDAVVVGLPDERFGQQVAVVVSLAEACSLTDLQTHLRTRLAGYKLPRSLVVVTDITYTGPGKPDLAWARRQF